MSLIRFVPNILSFSCVPLALLSINLFGHHKLLLIILIITINYLSDILDGAIARKFNCVTTLGKYLDKVGDIFSTTSIVYLILLNYYWLSPPYAIFGVGLLYKSATYRNFDMIEFTHMNIFHSFVLNLLLPCIVIISLQCPEIQFLLPFLFIGSMLLGVYCTKEAYREWKLGPHSRGPYFGRFLW